MTALDLQEKTHCDRCQETLTGARMRSSFTTEALCVRCVDKETELKRRIADHGVDSALYEGCGYHPHTPREEDRN